MKYGLYTRFDALPGKRRDLVDVLVRAAQLVGDAPGCHLYLVNEDLQEEHSVWVTELWDSPDQHLAALSIDGASDLIAEAMPLLDGKPRQLQLHPVGGKGIISS